MSYQNILKEFEDFSDIKNKDWYRDVHTWAKGLGEIKKTSALIACLSQNTSWKYNKTLVENALRDGEAGNTIPLVVEKANRILAYEEPLSVLRGPKITSFYKNILDPEDDYTVTVDRHSFAIFLGQKIDQKNQKWLSGQKNYDEVATAYRDVAREVEMLPSEVQAITWVSWRERFGGKKII